MLYKHASYIASNKIYQDVSPRSYMLKQYADMLNVHSSWYERWYSHTLGRLKGDFRRLRSKVAVCFPAAICTGCIFIGRNQFLACRLPILLPAVTRELRNYQIMRSRAALLLCCIRHA